MAEEKKALSGMKEIVAYCGSIGLPRTEASILQLKLQEEFPMKKIFGIWMSDKDMITEWLKNNIAGKIEEASRNKIRPKKKALRSRR